MTSRITRGFHRIGTVLATPPLLLAIWLAAREAWLQWSTKDPWAAFPTEGKTPNVFDQFDPPAYVANYTTVLLLLGLAVALYVGARALGWIADGFAGGTMSEGRSPAAKSASGEMEPSAACTSRPASAQRDDASRTARLAAYPNSNSRRSSP